jgi:hypothetical protein
MLAFFLLGLSLWAQSSGPVLLGEELQDIDRRTAQTAGLSAAQKRELLAKKARLLVLSGNIEGAAEAWNSAARLESDRDDPSLLEEARCLIALGELEKAESNVLAVLLKGPASSPATGEFRTAQYLAALIEGFRSASPSGLISLLKDPENTDLAPAILYTIWKITGDSGYAQRLTTGYPESPEGMVLLGEKVPQQVTAAPTAMWFLPPDLRGTSLQVPAPEALAYFGLEAPVQSAVQPPAAAPAPAVTPTDAPPGSLQTGLFSREENARSMADRIRRAGFSPSITRRQVNGTDYWSVHVPPGQNMMDTIIRLKDAGFESFPVY